MPSIRWIRNVTVNGVKCTLEVVVGMQHIADRCYVRINQEPELWFTPLSESRDEIVKEAMQILYQRLQGTEVLNLDGTPFQWE
ncbi:MAG: hypothetical protein LBC85_05360 [Fibromonadaceae bacterium]|nr:hypothetical protein [Fibromonadaceae bacterium]